MRFIHQPGSKPLAGYTIQRGIHRGGFGEVYYAHSDGGKEVALKLLQHEQEVELRGVQQCLNLKHPNLVNLFDVRKDSTGEQWVVMEYVNGASLEDVLAAFPNGLPICEVNEWLSGIIAGVAYLHDRGIVHRDLKPANVYRENGIVKVGDVGLSKRLGSDRRGTHTQSVGTVYYMAPEVAHGQYGPEVDVYSLGIMLYELITGQVPFTGETSAEVLMKHLTAVPNLHKVPASLRPVIARSLEKDPERRTPSVLDLEREFAQAMAADLGLSAAVDTLDNAVTTSRRQQNENTGFANGFAVSVSTHRTKSTRSQTVFDPVSKTATSAQVVTPRVVATRTAAQAASAYAQYPPQPIPETATASTEIPPENGRLDSGASPKATNNSNGEEPKSLPRQFGERVGRLKRSQRWPMLLTAAAGLWLFSPGSLRSWTGLAILAFAYLVGSALRGKSHDETVQFHGNLGRKPRSKPVSPPPTVWDSLEDVSSTIALGCISACLISIGGLLSMEFIQRTPRLPSTELMAMFTITSMVGTSIILLAGKLLRKGSWFEKNPRKTFLTVGILIGTAACFLNQYLLVSFSNQAFAYSPAYRSIGVHSLTSHEMNPTWLGFCVFFGGLMFWHRWWQDFSPVRSKRLSLGRLITAGIAAWVITIMFAFPQWPAILWAITISAAVQLSSVWSPRQSRILYGRK